MPTAEINVDDKALASKLAEMRAWLDETRFEASSFTYFRGPTSLIVRVSFSAADEARKFGGTPPALPGAGGAGSFSTRRSLT